jgi:hypothetical protein
LIDVLLDRAVAAINHGDRVATAKKSASPVNCTPLLVDAVQRRVQPLPIDQLAHAV